MPASGNSRRNLQATRRNKHYIAVLLLCYNLFTAFTIHNQLPSPTELAEDPSRAESVLERFIQHLYDDDRPMYLAKHTILAMQYYHRSLKGRLRVAWDSIESWGYEQDATNRPPMTVLILFAFVALCRLRGMQALRQGDNVRFRQLFIISILAEASFFGLLRPGEMFALCKVLIYMPSSSTSCQWAVAAVERPKAWRAMGKRQFATLRSRNLVAWLAWLIPHFSNRMLFWSWSPVVFRNMMTEIMCELGLQKWHFTPGSFRAGGATHWAQLGIDVGRLRFWGPRVG